MRKIFIILTLALVSFHITSAEKKTLSLKKFLITAKTKDPEFKKILIDRLYGQYIKKYNMTSSDLILSIDGEYNLNLNDLSNSSNTSTISVNNYEGTISLSKIFAKTGTSLGLSYSAGSRSSAGKQINQSTLTAQVNQSLVQNSFGKSTKILSKKLDLENKIIQYQVIESYEDYLASMISLYLNWYSSLKYLETAQSIVQYNNNLLYILQRKRRYGIAFPEDVKKIQLEVLTARENLIALKDQNQRNLNSICLHLGIDKENLSPLKPSLASTILNLKNSTIGKALEKSRTIQTLKLLEKNSDLAVGIAKDTLLPSVELYGGYSLTGSELYFQNPNHIVFLGISSSINFNDEKNKAQLKISKLDKKKQKLSTKSLTLTYKKNLFDTQSKIKREKELIDIFKKKVTVALQIYGAEIRNYKRGRTSLSDLIKYKNTVVQNRYNLIMHEVIHMNLLIEWKRLTDTLVTRIR